MPQQVSLLSPLRHSLIATSLAQLTMIHGIDSAITLNWSDCLGILTHRPAMVECEAQMNGLARILLVLGLSVLGVAMIVLWRDHHTGSLEQP